MDARGPGWQQGRRIGTPIQGAQPHRSLLRARLCLPRRGDAALRSSQGHRQPRHGAPPPKGCGWILRPCLAEKRRHLGPCWKRLRPERPRGMPRELPFAHRLLQRQPSGQGLGHGSSDPVSGVPSGQRSEQVTPLERFTPERQGQPATDGHTALPARKGKGRQGGIRTPRHKSQVCSGYSPPASLRSGEAQAGLHARRREGAPRHQRG